MKKAKFKNSESVYLEFSNGDIRGPYTVKSSHFQPLTRIYMYSFEETSMYVGEMYLKRNTDDKRLSYTQCMHVDNDNIHPSMTALDDFLSSKNKSLADGVRKPSGDLDLLFFRPDSEFINWIKEYAGNRTIIDIGCGIGLLTRELNDAGAKCVGIDMRFNPLDSQKINSIRIKNGKNIIHFISDKVENQSELLRALKGNALLICARPDHGNMVESVLKLKHKDSEFLYITIPENLTRYNDLGKYKYNAVKIKHKGSSVDNEIVLSVK